MGGSREFSGRTEPSPTGIPSPCSSPNFNSRDFGFSGPGAPITSSQRASSPGQGSLALESSLMLGFCLDRSSSPGLCFQRRESLRPSNFKPSLVSPPPVHWTPDPKFQGSLAVDPRATKFKFSLAPHFRPRTPTSETPVWAPHSWLHSPASERGVNSSSPRRRPAASKQRRQAGMVQV